MLFWELDELLLVSSIIKACLKISIKIGFLRIWTSWSIWFHDCATQTCWVLRIYHCNTCVSFFSNKSQLIVDCDLFESAENIFIHEFWKAKQPAILYESFQNDREL